MHHFISFILRIAYAAVFGVILLWHTGDIIKYIPQLLGGLLLFECVAQLLELFVLKTKTKVHGGFFIVPASIMLYGLFLVFFCNLPLNINLNEFASSLGTMIALKIELKIGGFCFLAFVLSELVISAVFFKPLYQPKKFAEDQAKIREAQRVLEEERTRQAYEEAARAADLAEKEAAKTVQTANAADKPEG